jgi:RNA polymerase sigma-70 factor, ECF subfamily
MYLSSIDEIMQRVKHGCEEAMRELMEKTAYPLEKLAENLLYDKNLCADAVQEAFIKIWVKREQYDEKLPAWPWMARILRNECHLQWRRGGARRREFDWGDLETEAALHVPSTLPQPDKRSEQGQLCDFARESVSELSDSLREVAQLCLFSELHDSEIAELLGIPTGTVKSRKSRALSILKSKMKSIIEGNHDGNH